MLKNNISYEIINDFNINDIDAVTRSHWVDIIKDFEATNAKAVKISCRSDDEKKCCRASINNYMRKNNHDWTIVAERGTNNLYVVRA